MRRWVIAIFLLLGAAGCGSSGFRQSIVLYQGPIVSGNTTVGSVLSTTTGTWRNNPTLFTYQWQNCNAAGGACTPIVGATSSTYTLAAQDLGDTIEVVVTAANRSGTASQVSAPTIVITGGGGPVPANTTAPYFCGDIALDGCSGGVTQSAVQGQVLAVGTGTWTNSPSSFGYQWKRCPETGGQPPTITSGSCTTIVGATSSTYTVVAGDVGKALVPLVTATNGGGSTSTSLSGACNTGSTVYVNDTSGSSQLNGDPAIAAGCSPISAVAGSVTGTGAGAMKFCTNAPVTCGLADPLSGNAGVPPGTALTAGSLGTCTGTITGQYVAADTTISSGTCTITNSRFTGTVAVNSPANVTFNHDDLAGPYTGASTATTGTGRITNISSVCTYTVGAAGGVSGNTSDHSVGGSGVYSVNNSYVHCAEEPAAYITDMNTSYVISDECWGPCDGGATTHNEAVYTFGGTSVWQNVTAINDFNNGTGATFNDSGASTITLTNSLGISVSAADGTWGIDNIHAGSASSAVGNRVGRMLSASVNPCFSGQSSDITWTGNIWDDDASSIATC